METNVLDGMCGNPVIAELAGLSPIDYDRVREEKAKELKVRVKTLDNEVAKLRLNTAETETDDVVEELSPWSDPVDGDKLLFDITRQIINHTAMQTGCPTVAAVWSLGSFCLDAFRIFPKLQLKSPEKRCGKSTLMECIEGVTCRPLMASNITASVLFRCIEAWHPTLLIDEADTFAKDNDELNGIINCGHTRRGAFVLRTVKEGEDHVPKKFCVWGAQVISGIKDQRDTLEDRSITIEMRRRKPSESVAKMTIDYFDRNRSIRERCLRWATDNINALKRSDVVVPPCGNDRAEDNWFPLFAIAALAGGDWPARVQKAYSLLEAPDDADSAAVMLLSDIKTVFDERGVDKISSDDLVAKLIIMDDRPWAEWKHGFPMTKTSLSKLLKPHKIKPKLLRISTTPIRGYELKAFQDAFDRYILTDIPVSSVTTLHPSAGAGFNGFKGVTPSSSVTFQKPPKPSAGAGCNVVTDENAISGHTTPACPNCDGEGCGYCRQNALVR